MNESLVSVVAPLEGDTPDVVQAFVEETVAVLRGVVTHYEIILVDDGAAEANGRARSRAARAATISCAFSGCRATSAKRRRSPPVSTWRSATTSS